ncbi:ABC transporter substrate-binding protein [Propioniciclava flava]|uniref:ABC transporter substrate-binding protein n=1 Tax=Propioniciclava flava TaxID=2072026 RepID=A0A4Q2ECI4_9ACTN|nr:ABC transporter substrate-binding protein [Propioniciclava flava]RXW31107.1 ABC transporter substrate-binding protein [Propioniciclava flava]
MENGSLATTRRGFLKLTGAIGAAAALAGSLSACGTTPAQRTAAPGGATASAKSDGTITAAISYELGTNGFDPMTTSAALTVAANWHTMEGLTEILPSGKRDVYAALAKELPVKVDDTTYEATLRDGAVFHNGSPVTTDDVVYSFERVLDPNNKSLYRQFIPFISSVTAKDDKTVTIKLSYPVSLVAERVAVVKIVPKAVASADAKAFDANPVGTGPYKMTDNSATSKEIKFERNEAYTGPRPALAKEMTWKIMPDDATRTNALTSKAVQAMDLVPDLSIGTLQQSATVAAEQGFSLLFAMFNMGAAPFNDVKNRQAFFYALDMPKMIQTAYLGNATPATSFVQETHPDYQKASTVYTYDAEKAKALLAETGLKSFRLLCTDHGWVKKITPLIKEALEAVGLSVDFTEKKSADVYNTIDGKPDAFDVVVAPGDPSVFGNDPDLLMRWWFAGDVWTDSRMHWKGSDSYNQMQTLLNDGLKQESAEQKATWGKAFNLLSDEIPLYPLFHRKTTSGYDKTTLVDFKPIALTGLDFLDTGSTK